jgi:hypothetical protein
MFEAEHLLAQGRLNGESARVHMPSHPAEQGFEAEPFRGSSFHPELVWFQSVGKHWLAGRHFQVSSYENSQ